MYRTAGLGVLPFAAPVIAIGVGSAIELLHSWYDPQFYQRIWLEGDLEQKVALLNNYWHHLSRSGTESGFTRHDPVMKRVNQHMDQWWEWRTQFNEALLRRWIPFVGRDWEDELYRFKDLFEEDYYELLRVGGTRAQEALASRGAAPQNLPIDRSALDQAATTLEDVTGQASRALGDSASRALFWPSVVVITGALGMIWLISRASAR